MSKFNLTKNKADITNNLADKTASCASPNANSSAKTQKLIESLRHRKRQDIALLLVLTAFLFILISILMMFGNSFYDPHTIFRVLAGEQVSGASFTILELRLPRVLLGALVGFAFGLAGNSFQKLLGNPLASPDIIGISAGASIAAVFGILIFKLPGSTVSLMALISGLLVALAIYLISQGKDFSQARLILVGIGFQAFLSAGISFLLLRASQYDVGSALRWLSGSLNSADLSQIPLLALVVIIFGLVIVLCDRRLQILELGHEYASALGARPQSLRLCLMVSALFLIAFATAQSGPVASVAFLSGPIALRLSKSGRNHPLSAALVGALLVLGAEALSQLLLPTHYPVGVVTGILGAPYLLWLLLRINKKGSAV